MNIENTLDHLRRRLKMLSRGRVVVNLTMPGVPALSIKQNCFDTISQQFSKFTWSFCNTEQVFKEQIIDADIILCWTFKANDYELAPKLQAIFTPAAGREWIAEDPAGKVHIFHSHFHGTLMAESLLGMISYFNNSFSAAIAFQKNKIWGRESIPQRIMLQGQHIIIVGYGSIGKKCAEVLIRNGCSVTGVKRDPEYDSDPDNGSALIPFDKLTAYLSTADHVVLILPDNQSTTAIITREHIQAMKSSAVLHNIGRGNCLADKDLSWALKNGMIKGAALDVFETEPLPATSTLWEYDNVLITPHSTCFYDEYGHLFASEIEAVLTGVTQI